MVGDKYGLISRVAGSFDSEATFSIIFVAATNILIINLYPFTQLLYILKSNY